MIHRWCNRKASAVMPPPRGSELPTGSAAVRASAFSRMAWSVVAGRDRLGIDLEMDDRGLAGGLRRP